MSDEYEYEYEYTPEQAHNYTFKPKKTVDNNWELLKQQQLETVVTQQPIILASNIKAYIYSDDFVRGTIKMKATRADKTQEVLRFNLTFDTNQPNGVSQQHYKIWDLLKTLASVNNWTVDRAFIYKPNDNETWTTEISLFRLKERDLHQYFLLVNDQVFVMRSQLEANLVLSTEWRDRQHIDGFYNQLYLIW